MLEAAMRRFVWLIAFAPLLVWFYWWFSNGRSGPSSNVTPPLVSATLTGPKQVVFDTRDGCEKIDIPDAPARAFRDSRNVVHLIATHYVARAMTGPSLDLVKHNCRVIYRSPQDPDPSHFEDNNWLYSFYTEDGRHVAALVHSEFDGEEIHGMCATPNDTNNCWWNTVTFAQSSDGGNSFTVPAPPQNLVAAVPWPYVVGNLASAYGYTAPTNIQKVGALYYALINSWPRKSQKYGACLIRTADLFEPNSWRAWDGKGFTVRFADPYREAIAKPEEHVCEPVLAGAAESLLRHMESEAFVVTQFAPDQRFDGPGFYIQASRDLIHWSKPSLVVSLGDLRTSDGEGKWNYDYVSLLDPMSADRNFSSISSRPYLYYVRSDGNDPPYARVLFRRQISLRFGK